MQAGRASSRAGCTSPDLTPGVRRCRTLRGWKDEGKWCALARLLDFTPEQQERIFVARSDMLAKLAAVYEARQALNDQARALLQEDLGPDQQHRLRGVSTAWLQCPGGLHA